MILWENGTFNAKVYFLCEEGGKPGSHGYTKPWPTDKIQYQCFSHLPSRDHLQETESQLIVCVWSGDNHQGEQLLYHCQTVKFFKCVQILHSTPNYVHVCFT